MWMHFNAKIQMWQWKSKFPIFENSCKLFTCHRLSASAKRGIKLLSDVLLVKYFTCRLVGKRRLVPLRDIIWFFVDKFWIILSMKTGSCFISCMSYNNIIMFLKVNSRVCLFILVISYGFFVCLFVYFFFVFVFCFCFLFCFVLFFFVCFWFCICFCFFSATFSE